MLWTSKKFQEMSSDVIRRLPDSVANQIAAGEVIQRPASVVKELVENAVDAGATSIQIIIKDAGRTLIQIVDNGCGMSPIDARMAFERHATSKIDKFDDLFTLHTMGFRGEALPSVAAVAQIELRTMRRGDTMGSRLRISESRFEGSEPCTCVPGTNIMVKNLFFHLPARRKYLKKDSVELSHILREFERLALVNTGIDFTIIHNGVTLHSLLKGTLKQRITSLFGKAVGAQILPLATETPIVKISGFTGVPHAARKRGFQQFFFVNGRNMRHPYFHKALMSCYEDLIAPDVQPSYFINFEVDPSTIDVNVHPQKHEIKFENEQAIWQILTAAVREALGKVNAAGAIDFDSPDAIPDIPVFLPDSSMPMPDIQTDPDYNPFNTETPVSPQPHPRTQGAYAERRSGAQVPKNWDELYKAFETRRDNESHDEPDEVPQQYAEIPSSPLPQDAPRLFDLENTTGSNITFDNRYIIVPGKSGLLFIHRNRAHVRVLFEKFMKQLESGPMPSQRLIFPESFTLSPSRSATLSAMSEVLPHLGYDVSFLGDNVWAVNAVPSLPGTVNPIETLMRMIDDIAESGEMPRSRVLRPAALALARSAAFNAGNRLTPEETEALIAGLLSSTDSAYTPDGLKITSLLRHDDIAKMF